VPALAIRVEDERMPTTGNEILDLAIALLTGVATVLGGQKIGPALLARLIPSPSEEAEADLKHAAADAKRSTAALGVAEKVSDIFSELVDNAEARNAQLMKDLKSTRESERSLSRRVAELEGMVDSLRREVESLRRGGKPE